MDDQPTYTIAVLLDSGERLFLDAANFSLKTEEEQQAVLGQLTHQPYISVRIDGLWARANMAHVVYLAVVEVEPDADEELLDE